MSLPKYRIKENWTHAGGVTYRGTTDPEILLVRARPAPHDWVLPKGHIEPGETPDACARREIREEAGVDAEPVVFLGDDGFTKDDGKAVSVAFFLMRYLRDVPPDEDRPRQWCTLTEALSCITFDGGRRIIRAAETYLRRTG